MESAVKCSQKSYCLVKAIIIHYTEQLYISTWLSINYIVYAPCGYFMMVYLLASYIAILIMQYFVGYFSIHVPPY